jgi:hypothetical protein
MYIRAICKSSITVMIKRIALLCNIVSGWVICNKRIVVCDVTVVLVR